MSDVEVAHKCTPDRGPETLEDVWTCPDCGKRWGALDVHAHVEAYVPSERGRWAPGKLGWHWSNSDPT